MCAMMPMLRVLLNGVCLGINETLDQAPGASELPPIMRKRLVRFGHPVCVLPLLHRTTAQIGGIEQFVRELFLHRLPVAPRAGVADDPPDAQREAPIWIDLDRHLVVRPADAPGFHLETWFDVVDRLLEDLERVIAALVLDDVKAHVENPLRSTTLAMCHHAVDELADEGALIERIGRYVTFWNFSPARHKSPITNRSTQLPDYPIPRPSSGAWRRTSSGLAYG